MEDGLEWIDGRFTMLANDSRSESDIRHDEMAVTEVAEFLLRLPGEEGVSLSREVLLDERRAPSTQRACCADVAAATALVAGIPGVQMLADVALCGSYKSSSEQAVWALWLAASGDPAPGSEYVRHVSCVEFPISESTRGQARLALDDLILASRENLVLFSKIIGLANLQSIANQVHGGANVFMEHVMGVFSKGSIAISSSILEKFAGLIEDESPREAVYQRFLEKSPTILDPLAAEVVPQWRLGSDYITDFVIRRHDNKYLVVEIEKPRDRIFTAGDEFTSEFTHALGQVLDFQTWVSENNAYARSKLPGIDGPRGLLVIGRRVSLTARQQSKLHRWQINSNHIDVMTYDDLLMYGRQLLKSLAGLSGGEE